jgi:prefoldin subunit 5
MGEPHVLTALQDKFRRIKGQIDALNGQASQLRADLDHIEAVIRMFRQTGGQRMKPL